MAKRLHEKVCRERVSTRNGLINKTKQWQISADILILKGEISQDPSLNKALMKLTPWRRRISLPQG